MVDDLEIDPDTEKKIREIAETFVDLTDGVFEKIKTINISALVPQSQLDDISTAIDNLPSHHAPDLHHHLLRERTVRRRVGSK